MHSAVDVVPVERVVWNSGQGVHILLPTLGSYEAMGHGLQT